MTADKLQKEFEAAYVEEMVRAYGEAIRGAAQVAIDHKMPNGEYAAPMLRLGLWAWRASRAPFWQPIDTCPAHEDVLFFRADAGVFAGKIADADSFMDDKQRDEWEGAEEDLFCLDAFGYGPWGVCRCDGSERPTYWMPLPAEPEVKP